MPNKKKRAFTKGNSVKFLLLHGNNTAQNADGETLENIFVPVSRCYKAGSSLLVSCLKELDNETAPPSKTTEEGDLNMILNKFEDASDSEVDDFDALKKRLGDIQIGDKSKISADTEIIIEEEYEDYDEEDPDNLNDFSDSDFSDAPEISKYSQRSNLPENVQFLEDRFEKKLEEYEDDQLGALDDEDICGYLTGESKRVNFFLEPTYVKPEEVIEINNFDKSLKEKILKYSEEETVDNYVEIVTEKPLEYDCESIISTYSNKYNHPEVIREVRKITVPKNPLKKNLTKSKLKQLESESESEEESDDNCSIATSINIRNKEETPEQRKERKSLFREAKRESRMLKKENKLAFKHEKKLQMAQAINVQNNRGIRLH